MTPKLKTEIFQRLMHLTNSPFDRSFWALSITTFLDQAAIKTDDDWCRLVYEIKQDISQTPGTMRKLLRSDYEYFQTLKIYENPTANEIMIDRVKLIGQMFKNIVTNFKKKRASATDALINQAFANTEYNEFQVISFQASLPDIMSLLGTLKKEHWSGIHLRPVPGSAVFMHVHLHTCVDKEELLKLLKGCSSYAYPFNVKIDMDAVQKFS